MRFRFYILLLLIVVAPLSVRAQTALNAPPDDPVYHAVDVFIANDLVRDVIIGQRPYSRLEIARILRSARETLDEREGIVAGRLYLERLLAFYEKRYARELGGMPKGVVFEALDQLDLFAAYNSSEPRQIPVNNGAGMIDGIITSFDRYTTGGLTYVDGANATLTTQHDLYATPYLAMRAKPRFEFLTPQRSEAQVFAHIERLYLTTGWRNIQLEVGRDNLMWGQGEYGGLMLSSNARPLDMIKLTNPYPWRAPWVFKYLGHMKFTFFVSNLGPERTAFPYAYLYGLKFSLRPSRWFEFGLSHTITMGGRGAPGVKWWEPIAEMLPFHKWGGSNIGATDVANNSWGFLDFRLTIPPLRGSQLYYDAYIEDSIVRAFRLPDNILNQMSFIVGCYVPRLTSSGEVGLRLEGHHVAPLTYRHGTWTDGYTLNRRLLGDPLGPTADGVYATLYWWPSPRHRVRFDAALEDYDSSTYYTQPNASGGGDKILVLTPGPHERRFRLMGEMSWQTQGRIEWTVLGGYERIENWNFIVGRGVNNMMVGARLRLHFDEFTIGER